MTRQISSAVCRNPEVYREVCENILRVDISCLKSEFYQLFASIARERLTILFSNCTFIILQKMISIIDLSSKL